MKKWPYIIVCIILLLSNIYFFIQYQACWKTQRASYTLKINHGIENGINKSIRNMEYCLKALENDEDKQTIMFTLGNLAASLKVSQEVFSLIHPEVNLSRPVYSYSTMNEICDFFGESYRYVYSDLMVDINIKSPEEIAQGLEELNKGFRHIKANINQEILYKGNYKSLEQHWDKIIGEVVSNNPEQAAFKRYKEKYFP